MADGNQVNILLVDEQVLFAESLRCVIEARASEMHVSGVAHNGNDAVLLAMKLRPDIILMDVNLPGMDGIQAAREIHRLYPEIKIVMLTAYNNDDYVKVSLQYGALGYLLKNIQPEELVRTLRSVRHEVNQIAPEVLVRLFRGNDRSTMAAECYYPEALTTREKEILELCLRAFNNQSISGHLKISEQTVKNHIHNIYSKLGVSSRLELIKLMGRRDQTPYRERLGA